MIGSVWGEVSETRSRHRILSRKICSKTHLRVRNQYQVNNWYFKLDLELFKYNNKFRKGYTLRADDHPIDGGGASYIRDPYTSEHF